MLNEKIMENETWENEKLQIIDYLLSFIYY